MYRPRHKLRAWLRREEGQTMAEYTVVLGVITLGIITVFAALSGSISTSLTNAIGLI